MSLDSETLKIAIAAFGPILASYLTYRFAIKGKVKDIDLQRTKELNLVLSNSLLVWNYLEKFRKVLALKRPEVKLSIPKKILPYVLLKTDMLNDTCFKDLERSIENLNKYDPFTYFRLEGIGKKFDYMREKLIVPFVKNPNANEATDKLSEQYLDKLIDEIRDTIIDVSKLLGKSVSEKAEKALAIDDQESLEELIEEIDNVYYDVIVYSLPPGFTLPPTENLREFIASNPQIKEGLDRQFDLLLKFDFNHLIEIVAKNPSITLGEMEELMESSKI
jgi:hypothetical protein